MLFNSYIFIFLFLPLALIGYFVLNRLGRNMYAKVFLLVMSLWFYGYFNYTYLAVIISSIAVNYAVVYLMRRYPGRKKLCLAAGLVFDIGMLFYFKYANFVLRRAGRWSKCSMARPLI